jgi:Primase C terminal 1 (PriCT-1)
LSPKAHDLFNEHSEKVTTWLSVRKEKFEAGKLKPMADDPPCIKRLLESGAKKGNRNNVTFQLAVFYASKGLSQDEIEKLCTQYTVKSEEPLTPTEISTLADSALKGYTEGRYSVGCSTFLDLCDKPKCPLFQTDDTPNWDAIGEPISYDEWRKTIQANFPALWTYAEACAATIAVLQIQNVQPLALVLQGVPSGGKTTTLDFFRNFPLNHATDKFSPRAFVSHVAQKSEEELKKIDMLPRIKGKVLITPDLTTLFGAKSDDLSETFSILTRVLDGRGLKIDSGVYCSRGYEGDYMFAWIGASTPIPHKVWDLFGNLGARMYFMHIMKSDHTNQEYINALKEKNYRIKVNECNDATLRFLKGIWQAERIEWNSKDDPDDLIDKIVQLAKIVTRLRGKINVVVKEEFGRQETFFSEAIIEEPDRCISSLYSMMRGHALLQGRRQIAMEDLPVIIDVALSSVPWDRILAFAYVLSKDNVNATELEKNLKCSRGKALRTMQTLKLLDLVDLNNHSRIVTNSGEQFAYEMKLKPEFKWFQSQEFKALWRQKPAYPEVPVEIQEPEPTVPLETFALPQEPRPAENMGA